MFPHDQPVAALCLCLSRTKLPECREESQADESAGRASNVAKNIVPRTRQVRASCCSDPSPFPGSFPDPPDSTFTASAHPSCVVGREWSAFVCFLLMRFRELSSKS